MSKSPEHKYISGVGWINIYEPEDNPFAGTGMKYWYSDTDPEDHVDIYCCQIPEDGTIFKFGLRYKA